MSDKSLLNILRIRAADAEEIWRTIRGAKVMIDKGTGEIKGGAGGKMNGMKYRPGFARSLKTGKRVLLPGLHTKVSHFKGTKADLLKKLGKAVEPPKPTDQDLKDAWKVARKKMYYPAPLSAEKDKQRREAFIGALEEYLKLCKNAGKENSANAKKARSMLGVMNHNVVRKGETLATAGAVFAKAKTTEELHKAFMKKGFYKKADQVALPKNTDCARMVCEGASVIFNRYPVLNNKFLGLRTEKPPFIEKNAYAHCFLTSGSVGVNSMYFEVPESLKKSYKYCVSVKFHAEGTDERSILVHEYGHALNGIINSRLGYYSKQVFGGHKTLEDHIYYNVCGFNDKTKKNDIENQLSGYANKNHKEFFAEAMAEALCSPNPRPIAKKVLAEVDKLMDEYGPVFLH